MQQIAISWHLYLLTNSPLQLGLVGAVRSVPFITLSLIGGAMADSLDRRRLLWTTNLLQMLSTAVLVISTVNGTITPQLIYVIAFIQGGTSAFDAPTRQAMIPNIVPRPELANAMTLNTLLRQSSVVVGPAVGGLVIAQFGLSWAYAANAVSFLAVVLAVGLMRPLPKITPTTGPMWERFIGGWQYAQHAPLVLVPLGLETLRSLLLGANVYSVVFTRDIFHVGPEGLGTFRTVIAIGAVLGGIAIGTGRFSSRPVPLMVLGYGLEGASLFALALAPSFSVALAVMFLNGVGNVTAEVMRNTLVQLKTPDEVRGRVSALSQMATYGGPQLGQLQAGALVSTVGPTTAALSDGFAILAGSIVFGLLPSMRRAARERLD